MGIDLAQGRNVANELVIGARQRLGSRFFDHQASLKCFNGRFQILHHLQLPEGGLIRIDGRSRSTIRWGIRGGRVSLSPARRPVASWQLAVSDALNAVGSTSRRTGTRTKCSDVANALRANVKDHNRGAPGTTPTSRWQTPRAPSDRIDTVALPRGSEKSLWNTAPRGTMKARVTPAAPPNVGLITLVELPVYWDRP